MVDRSLVDQGFLDYLNFAAPACPVNTKLARAAKRDRVVITVPLGQACPPGYTSSHLSGLPPNNLNTICEINTPTTEQISSFAPLAYSFMECARGRTPTSGLVCDYCKCPPGSGRVDPGCPPQNMACMVCPNDFVPNTPLPPSVYIPGPAMAPVPGPAMAPVPGPDMAPAPEPASVSELPIWAIILIIIAVFGVVGGLIYAGIKMSQ